MPKLPTEIFDAAVEQLLPFMDTTNERQAQLIPILLNEPVFSRVDWQGASREFTVKLVSLLSHDQLIAVLRRLPVGEPTRSDIEAQCARIAAAACSSPEAQAAVVGPQQDPPKGDVAADKQMPPPPDEWLKWLKRAIQVAAVFFGATYFVGSLVPGTASLIIHAPNEIPMTLETLQVEIIPVGLLGEAGGDHIRHDGFDSRGVAQISIKLGMLETLVKCRVYDKSSPSLSVINELVYVSPLVRHGILPKV